MGAIVSAVIGILTGKAGEEIGGKVARAVEIGAVIAALAPVGMWLAENKEGIFISITYGDLAFWGVILGAVVFVTVRLVHYAPPPR